MLLPYANLRVQHQNPEATMPLILPVKGVSPTFGSDCFIAENAVIIGEVAMGDQCSIW